MAGATSHLRYGTLQDDNFRKTPRWGRLKRLTSGFAFWKSLRWGRLKSIKRSPP